MRWRKIQQNEEEEPEAQEAQETQEEEPLDYIIDEASLEAEETQERKGGFRDFIEGIKNRVAGVRIDEEAEQEYASSIDDQRIVVQTDRDFKITFINDRAKQFLSLGDEAIGKSIAGTMISSGEESERLLERVRQNFFDGQERFQNIVVRAYNRVYNISWLSISVEALHDEECGIVGIMWTARDISDSVLMSKEEATAQVPSLISAIDDVPAPLLVVGSGRVIVAWNKRFLDIFKVDPAKDIVTPETLLSVLLLNVVEHHAFVEKAIRLSDPSGGPFSMDLKDGRKFLCQGTKATVEGYEGCVVWTFQQVFSQGRWMGMEPSENRPDLHMEDIPDLLWEIDSTHRIIYASQGLGELIGHHVDDMAGLDLFHFVDLEDHVKLKDILSKTDGAVHRAEVRMIRADGNLAYMQLDIKRLPDKNSLPTGHLIAGGDVSDRKRAERSLVDMVHAFRTLMEHTHDGVWMMDESGVVIQWNEAMEEMTSIRPSEAIGRALPDLDPLCQGFTDIYERVVSKLNHKDMLILNNQVETVLTKRSGSSTAVKVEVHPITTDKGHLVMGICTMVGPREKRDVPAVDLYQRMVDNSPDLLLNLDQSRVITYCNRVIEGLLGRKWDDVIGREVSEVFPGWPAKRTDAPCGGQFDLEIRDTEGHRRTYHMTGVSMDNDTCQVHGEEITEKLQMKKRLLATEDLGRKLMEAFPDPAFLLDETDTVSFASEKATKLFDIGGGKPGWMHIVADFDQESAKELLSNVRQHGRCSDVKLHLIAKDLTQYVTAMDVEPVLNADGVMTGFLFILRSLALNVQAAPDESLGMHIEQEPLGAVAEVVCTPIVAEEEEELPFPIMSAADKWEQLSKFYPMIGKAEPRWISLQDMCQIVSSNMGDDVDPSGEIDGVEILADPLAVNVLPKLVENALVHGKKVTKVDVKFFVGDKGGYIVIEDDGVGVPTAAKEEIFEYSHNGRNGHDLHFVREVLFATQIDISESGDPERGARFEIFVPMGKFRQKKK
ncbi:MAG: sensory histidine kinase AtoS [Methanomassiliicoccales archaeon PtaU1.Bin124]|nr:MAG: sensory histidine kinase AtoS [Methanomassiliicoccales archaeon PtaU1.Bin124]